MMCSLRDCGERTCYELVNDMDLCGTLCRYYTIPVLAMQNLVKEQSLLLGTKFDHYLIQLWF